MSRDRTAITRDRLAQLIADLRLLRADGGTLSEAAVWAAGRLHR